MDEECLKNSRLVSSSWQNCIDSQNILWKKLLKDKDAQEPFQRACKNGHIKMAKILIQRSAEFNIDLNSKGKNGITGFHYACELENSKVVEILVQKSTEFKIDLNAKDELGHTAFRNVCYMGNLK